MSSEQTLALSRHQAAKACGISLGTFDKWLKDPALKLPHAKINRRIIVPYREFQRWLADQAT